MIETPTERTATLGNSFLYKHTGYEIEPDWENVRGLTDMDASNEGRMSDGPEEL